MIFLSVGLIWTAILILLDGKGFWAALPSLGFGVILLYGGIGLLFNWFDGDNFIYFPF